MQTEDPQQDLPTLPPEVAVDLDPRTAPILRYGEMGLSLDHMVEWPIDGAGTPHVRCATGEAVDQLISHQAFRPHATPIRLLDKVEPFQPGVAQHLLHVVRDLDRRGWTNHVQITTGGEVTAEDLAELGAMRHLRVTLLFRYSGLADTRVEPAAVLASLQRAAADGERRTGVVLDWRPIVPGWNDSDEQMSLVFNAARFADAIVFTGHQLDSLGDPAVLDDRVVAAWRRSGISTPLFRKTSCGVSFAHRTADYNDQFGIPTLCDICPAAQRLRCAGGYREPTSTELDGALAEYGFEGDYLVEDGHVRIGGLSVESRYVLQHALRHQAW
ncbi:hypothetical protein F4553_003044 [Allocatelliglobosispora scoriae]|uniref:Radical SAM protein n=1 Tax=Allocatelliglobosispora scoriae TaxID=643052 RepID=A0A841BPQ4_9ACTN|nr:hypothetical protein [Allocatelliglobosispora scoriae]MBB5869665.1 hypothetical protein [Allocatelliglobosispora scoriae]